MKDSGEIENGLVERPLFVDPAHTRATTAPFDMMNDPTLSQNLDTLDGRRSDRFDLELGRGRGCEFRPHRVTVHQEVETNTLPARGVYAALIKSLENALASACFCLDGDEGMTHLLCPAPSYGSEETVSRISVVAISAGHDAEPMASSQKAHGPFRRAPMFTEDFDHALDLGVMEIGVGRTPAPMWNREDIAPFGTLIEATKEIVDMFRLGL